MDNCIILYWHPGSGGDTVQQLLSLDSKFQVVVEKFDLSAEGRTTPRIFPWLRENFPHEPNKWLWRSWSHQDLELLQTWPGRRSSSTLILPTHSATQARWLKDHLPNSLIVGITYSESMFKCVLVNWCKKVAADDPDVIEHYQSWLHQNLRKKRLLAPMILKEQLAFVSNTPQRVLPEWDVNLSLEKLLIGDVSALQKINLEIPLIQPVLAAWLGKQKKFYRNRWDIGHQLKQALGYNEFAPLAEDSDTEFDQYDKILLRDWCKNNQVPMPDLKINTLKKADIWLKKIYREHLLS